MSWNIKASGKASDALATVQATKGPDSGAPDAGQFADAKALIVDTLAALTPADRLVDINAYGSVGSPTGSASLNIGFNG